MGVVTWLPGTRLDARGWYTFAQLALWKCTAGETRGIISARSPSSLGSPAVTEVTEVTEVTDDVAACSRRAPALITADTGLGRSRLPCRTEAPSRVPPPGLVPLRGLLWPASVLGGQELQGVRSCSQETAPSQPSVGGSGG